MQNDELLIPVIVQEINTKEVLMLAYADQKALELTKQTGYAHFYSRSKGRIWKKGEESGNTMKVVKILKDCDEDAILYLVKFPADKVACHTNKRTCFFKVLHDSSNEDNDEIVNLGFLIELKQLIDERKKELPEGSYTTRLFNEGIEKIAKKFGEESIEVVLAAMGNDKRHLVSELADLIYHLTVLLSEKEVGWHEIISELVARRKGSKLR